jgi:uncharacterized paraquat-inducible protein A
MELHLSPVPRHCPKQPMALVPCRECGTLNSDQSEICLSCEYPIKGRAKTNGFKWLAILLAAMFGLPLGMMALETLRQREPAPPQSPIEKGQPT